MSRAPVSAPGKAFLIGEYAVLEGVPALITAVDVRAVAHDSRDPERSAPSDLSLAAHVGARDHLARLGQTIGDAAIVLRSERQLLTQRDPVRGPAGLRLDDQLGIEVRDRAKVEPTGAELLRPIGVPQRDPILAADPRAMVVDLTGAVARERRTGLTAPGPIRSRSRRDLARNRWRRRCQPRAQHLTLELRHAKRLVATLAAARPTRDVFAVARHHRRDAVVDQPQMHPQPPLRRFTVRWFPVHTDPRYHR